MKDKRFLDEIRRQIQASLAQSNQEHLRHEDGTHQLNDDLTSEEENKFIKDLIEFERQIEEAPRITVRARIGNPGIEPAENIPPFALEEAVETLFTLLGDHNIAIDFMGEWDHLVMYRYITEELFDEEIDDVRVYGFVSCFEATTLEYDVQMWVEIFVGDLFWQDDEHFLLNIDKQSIYDAVGNPITLAEFRDKVALVWAELSVHTRADTTPLTTQVTEDEGMVTAVITWQQNGRQKQVESSFRLKPSPYFGWDVVQTSLLDDILALR